MASSTERVLAIVRRQILDGARSPGERISEVGIAGDLDVSRTPARTALAALQAEGLIEKRDGRGYTVRSISALDVAKAIAVRSALEALAARTMADEGMDEDVEETLRNSIAASEAIVTSRDPDLDHIGAYQEANTVFHRAIMGRCGNELIAHTFARISMLPFAGLGALVTTAATLEQERLRLTVGHAQHVLILDALKRRQPDRAEALMREHSGSSLGYAALFTQGGGRSA